MLKQLNDGRIIVAKSPAMKYVVERMEVHKPGEPILFEGTQGNGKKMLAKLLHDSQTPAGKFAIIDCNAYPSSYGAFPALIKAAEGGTLLLEHVEALPRPEQLILKNYRDFIVSGGSVVHHLKHMQREKPTTIVATTTTSTAAMAGLGFDQGTLYSFIWNLYVPSLAERQADIPELVALFVEEIIGQKIPPNRLCTIKHLFSSPEAIDETIKGFATAAQLRAGMQMYCDIVKAIPDREQLKLVVLGDLGKDPKPN